MSVKKATNTLNRVVVSAYKLFGFGALALILLGLAGYVVVNVFYLVDKNWVAPVILTPHHERVIKLNTELVEQQFQRHKLDGERLVLETQLRHIDRAIDTGEAFQAGFLRALESDQATREEQLGSLRDVYRDYRRSGRDIRDSLDAFADITRERTQDDFDANLIDRQTWLERNYLLSQVSSAELALEQTQVELQAQTRELEQRVAAVGSLRSEIDGSAAGDEQSAVSYEVLLMEREYRESIIELERLRDERAVLQQQMRVIQETTGEYDRILAAIQNSPYLRAMDEQLEIAFVPYDNLDGVEPGNPVYGCDLGLLLCEQVGEIVQILDGEVAGRHPLHNRDMRGVMVELHLTDPSYAEKATLHINRPPFFI